MVFSIHWFFDIGFVEALAINNQVIFVFLDSYGLVLIEKLIFFVNLKTIISFVQGGADIITIKLLRKFFAYSLCLYMDSLISSRVAIVGEVD